MWCRCRCSSGVWAVRVVPNVAAGAEFAVVTLLRELANLIDRIRNSTAAVARALLHRLPRMHPLRYPLRAVIMDGRATCDSLIIEDSNSRIATDDDPSSTLGYNRLLYDSSSSNTQSSLRCTVTAQTSITHSSHNTLLFSRRYHYHCSTHPRAVQHCSVCFLSHRPSASPPPRHHRPSPV